MVCLGHRDKRRDIVHIVRKLLNIETFAVRLAAAAQIERIDRKPAGHELFGHPLVIAAVRIETWYDDNNSARLAIGGMPRAGENLETADTFERSLIHCVPPC